MTEIILTPSAAALDGMDKAGPQTIPAASRAACGGCRTREWEADPCGSEAPAKAHH